MIIDEGTKIIKTIHDCVIKCNYVTALIGMVGTYELVVYPIKYIGKNFFSRFNTQNK